jgi:hypothetical protein
MALNTQNKERNCPHDESTEEGNVMCEHSYPWSRSCNGNKYNCKSAKLSWLAGKRGINLIRAREQYKDDPVW